MRLSFLVCACILSASRTLPADVVTLKKGDVIKGVVVFADDKFVKVRQGAGSHSVTHFLQREDIESIRLTPPDLASLKRVARKRIDKGDPRDAVTLWKYISALEPDVVENQVFRAKALRRLGRLNEAQLAADIAVKLDANDPRGYLEQGEIQLLRDKPKAAAKSALRYLKKSDQNTEAGYWLLGRAFEKSGLVEDAIEALRNVLKESKDHKGAFDRLAGLLLAKQGYLEVEAIARNRIKEKPKDRAGWLALGKALYLQARYDKAESVFRTATTLGGPGFDRSRVFLKLAETRRAEKDPLTAIDPEDHVIAQELEPELWRKEP